MLAPRSDTNKKQKPWKPQTAPFIPADHSDEKPYRMFQAVTFTRNLFADNTPEVAVTIAANYLEVTPEKLAYEIGRYCAFRWQNTGMSEQFKNGLRAGFNGGGQ
jgi:hypothetical protein